MQLISTIVLSLLITLTSCGSKKNFASPVPLDEVKYGLKKSACFGKCPVYKLEIYEGGKATLTATRHMDQLGTFEKQLSAEKYTELEAAFASGDWASYPDTVKSMIPDLPSVWLTYHDGSKSKTVYGKEGRPDKVVELEQLMNDIAMADDWKLIKSLPTKMENNTNADGTIEHQLIMQPIDGQTVDANWLGRYRQHKLTLVKQLAPDLNYFLLEYDTTTIKPTDMLELMKKDPSVKLVQFNKAASLRESDRR